MDAKDNSNFDRTPEILRLERTPKRQLFGDGSGPGLFMAGRPSKSGGSRWALSPSPANPSDVVVPDVSKRASRRLFLNVRQSTPVSSGGRLGSRSNPAEISNIEISPIGSVTTGSFLVPRQSHLALTDSHEAVSSFLAGSSPVLGRSCNARESSFMTIEEEEIIGEGGSYQSGVVGPRQVPPPPAMSSPPLKNRLKQKFTRPVKASGETKGDSPVPRVLLSRAFGSRPQMGHGNSEEPGRALTGLSERSEVSTATGKENRANSTVAQQKSASQSSMIDQARQIAQEPESSTQLYNPVPVSEFRVPARLQSVPVADYPFMTVPTVHVTQHEELFRTPPRPAVESESDWSPPRGLSLDALKEIVKRRAEKQNGKDVEKYGKLCRKRIGEPERLKRLCQAKEKSQGRQDGVQRMLKFSYSPVKSVSGSTPPGYTTPTGGETDPDMDFLDC